VLSALSIVFAAAEEAAHEEEGSKALFYVLGGLLAAYAVALAALGITRPEFPATKDAARGVMAVSAALVALTMASAVITG
jgi:hypothetical protein